jgi:hypothetical protein
LVLNLGFVIEAVLRPSAVKFADGKAGYFRAVLPGDEVTVKIQPGAVLFDGKLGGGGEDQPYGSYHAPLGIETGEMDRISVVLIGLQALRIIGFLYEAAFPAINLETEPVGFLELFRGGNFGKGKRFFHGLFRKIENSPGWTVAGIVIQIFGIVKGEKRFLRFQIAEREFPDQAKTPRASPLQLPLPSKSSPSKSAIGKLVTL